jgi:rod shape-determining protein MreD
MRWLSYFIFAYITLGAQVGLSAYLRLNGAPPNLVLLAVLFITLYAPRDVAMLAAFGLGLMQDLLTQQTLGLYALSYGLVASLLVSIGPMLNKEHPVTHAVLALVASFACAVVMLLHGWIHRPGAQARLDPSLLLYSGLYTTLLAPFALGIIQRVRWLFGFQAARRRVPHSYLSR